MKAKKKVAVVCLSIGAVLLLLTAFSGVNAWNQEGDAASTSQTGEDLTEGMIWSETKIPEAGSSEGTVSGDAASGAGVSVAVQSVTEESDGAEESSPETAAVPESSAPETQKQETQTDESGTEAQTEGETQEAADEETSASETAASESSAAEEENALEQAEIDYFEGQFMVTVTGNTALNVREEPDAESAWVGKMYAGSGGHILEEGDGWTKIESGSVVGWVSNDYILTGDAGREKALEDSELVIEVQSDALKVRSAPSTAEDNKLRAIYGGETYPVVSVEGDWVEIEYSEEKTGWVAADYVEIRYSYEHAMSRKEIEEAEEARKRKDVETTTRSSHSASYDETTLLACLIQCESGSYEGQLAVANVILNRVNSSKFPNSITEVIYAAGQFSPVRSGSLDARLAKGPSSTALQAATDALNGVNNIGDYLYFRSASSADTSSYSSYTVVAGNCFYNK